MSFKRLGAACLGVLLLTSLLMGCSTEDPGSETVEPGIPKEPSPAAVEPGEGSVGEGSAEPVEPFFVDVAEASGLDFHHFNGATGRFYMAEVTGAGVALFDYDLDGDLDVYLVQGSVLDPDKTVDDALFPLRHDRARDLLYRNELVPSGELRFTDVTEASGIVAEEYGMGAAVGDYDNDGRPDLYLTHFGPNQLWRNRGDGTFENTTAAAGVDDPRWSVPAIFLDYDRDGHLDLFVGNYIAADVENPKQCRGITGARDYCGPSAYPPVADRLFHNRGDGTFEDVTWAAGLRSGFGPALGAVATDLDGNGFLDIYVANDQANNQMWLNQGDGTFVDEALLAGSAVNAKGRAEASMGIDAGDFDGDGDDDLFMTHLIGETNTLYVNEGAGTFVDRSVDSGLASPSRLFTAFGTAWLDYDNDRHLDLFVANGAVKAVEQLMLDEDPFPYHHPNQLFRNVPDPEAGSFRFEDVSSLAGPALALSEVSRGTAVGDIDNDGDADLLVVNNNGPARLLLNRRGEGARWIGLRLADRSRGDAVGARLALDLDDGTTVWRRVRRDGSFASANDPRVLVGLGDPESAPAPLGLRVFWPDGTEEFFPGERLKLDAYQQVTQGTGQESPR